jgi:TPR repeat protein
VVPEEEEDDYAKVKNNPDCMGLLSFFEFDDNVYSDGARDDAVKSAKAHSKYGTFALGEYFLAMPAARARATRCFKISAKNANYDRAQDALGLMLLDLDSFPPADPVESAQLEKDRGKALRLFTSAANQGLPIAMFHLGDLCRVEAERLRPTADDADLRRMVSDARHWYQLSHYSHEGELEDLEALEMSLDVGNDEEEEEEEEKEEDA